MANDDTDQTGYTEEGHEAEWCVHDGQSNQCSDRTIGRGGEDKNRLDGIVELDKKCKIDTNE